MKSEYKIIADIITENTRVLDVGCDDGTLMEFLKKNKNVDIRGIEISKKKVQVCISKGLTVLEGNAEFDSFFKKLKEFNYQGPFIMQAYRDDEGVEILKKQLDWISPYLNG